jgi:glycosyltransferase involved in cell wall biosynthesis
MLLIRFGVFMSKQDINVGKYQLLSRGYTGDIFEKVFREDLQRFDVGRFQFHGLRISGLTRKFRILSNACFAAFVVLRAVIRHVFHERYEYVVTYEPFNAGVLGLILSRLLGCRLVCEVNGNYGEKKTWLERGSSASGLLKYYYCRIVIPFVLNRAFATKLLYPEQLLCFGSRIRASNIHVFHEFTPVLTQSNPSAQGDYLLFLGSPWHLKGVDVLIKAYKRVASEFPGFRLKIVGWFPEPGLQYLKSLCDGTSFIEICKAVHYEEAMRLVAGSYAVILPSRSEGMGRVLLEAMAYGKPIIASRVDGIPTYVKDEVNGLLFQSEDDVELSRKIARLCSDPSAADELGRRAYHYVRENLSEERYFQYYSEMLTGARGRAWV